MLLAFVGSFPVILHVINLFLCDLGHDNKHIDPSFAAPMLLSY